VKKHEGRRPLGRTRRRGDDDDDDDNNNNNNNIFIRYNERT
jgi:hypothetical protein